jgi:hypothetical protein
MIDAEVAYYQNLIMFWQKITIIVSVIPLIIGRLKWRAFNKPLKIYWYFLLLAASFYVFEQLVVWGARNHREFLVPILNYLNIKNTHFINILYHLNNFILLGWFLYLLLTPNPIAKWLKRVSAVLVVTSLINYFFIQGHNVSGGYNSTLSALYCFIVPLIYMWYLYNQNNKIALVTNPYFWISLGLIIPNILGLFLYFAGEDLRKESIAVYARLYLAKNGIEIFAQFLTAIGFYYANKVRYLTNEKFHPPKEF